MVLVFNLLVVQALYNMSDDQVELQARDRPSFHRLLGFYPEDMVPDATRGPIINPTLVAAPKSRDSRKENAYIKVGALLG